MKQDGRDLLAAFRSMAPSRRPIRVQRWSVRRVALIIASVLLFLLAVLTGIGLFFPTRGTVTGAPTWRPRAVDGELMGAGGAEAPRGSRASRTCRVGLERRHRRDDPGQGDLSRSVSATVRAIP